MHDKPLVLVIDLDSTLVYIDEENKLKQSNITMFYRQEMYNFFRYLREWFSSNLFLVLWSTGDNPYVQEIVMRMNLKFDLILGRKESNESEEYYGAPKALSFLLELPCIKEWVSRKTLDSKNGPIMYALIDDKANDNSSNDDPYHFTFNVQPITLNNIYEDSSGYFATVASLFEYGFFLVYHCITKPERVIKVASLSKSPSFSVL